MTLSKRIDNLEAVAATATRDPRPLRHWSTEHLRLSVEFIRRLPKGPPMSNAELHALLVEKFGVPPIEPPQPMENPQ